MSDQISTEIQNRGNSSLDCFDQSVISLEPALAVDRAEEKSVLVNLQSAALYEPWNIFWIEYFDTSAVDLVSDYSGRWVKTLTDERTESNPEGSIRLTGTPVSGGLAHVSNASYPWACNRYAYREGGYKLACSSIGGARSNVDVTPDQLFPIYISGITERNKWTVVLDYYVEQTPTGTDNHNPVFLRVNDRPCPGPNCWWLPADAVLYRWNGVAMEPTPPYSNQTRFGALVFRRDPGSTGALQFQGDSLVQGETGSYRYHLPPIQLNEEPFENPEGRLFRNQIVEEEHLTWGYPPIFELQWRAEFWDLTNGRLLNTQDPPVWFTEYTVKNVYGIKIPDMPGSRIMMGLGPGNGGQYGADLIGTAYWVN